MNIPETVAKKSTLFFLLFIASTVGLKAQKFSILPQPVSVQSMEGSFVISRKTSIVYNKNTEQPGLYFNNYLNTFYHFKITKSKNKKQSNNIVLNLSDDYPDTTIGAYSLNCAHNRIIISSRNPEGIFYGIQSLIQLLPVNPPKSHNLKIQNVVIKDAPRFAYRGMMLDVGRHFMPVAFVKKFIDYMALHKMNSFHWHLTEDQGWRIEIKKYPRLTEVGAWRNGTIEGHYPQSKKNDCIRTGGFYTQEEIRDIVRYAAQRYITIIPEIELPGHSSAAIAAYPQLSCFPDSTTEKKVNWCGPDTGKQVQQTWGVFKDVYAPTPYTFHFIENVLDEVMDLFPSKYIHIGGDECPKTYWKESPYCQQLMRKEGLKNGEELQSYFIGKIGKYLNSKGREIMGWDEIMEGGLTAGATVESWHGERGGIQAAMQRHNVIMAPAEVLYFTRPQKKQEDSLTVGGYLPMSRVYNYDPRGKMDSTYGKYVIGAEACLWTEYMKTPSKVEYMLFPRMAAVSEVFWTEPAEKDYTHFLQRLETEVERYKLWKVTYSKTYDIQ